MTHRISVLALAACLAAGAALTGIAAADGNDLDAGPDVTEGIGTSPPAAVPVVGLAKDANVAPVAVTQLAADTPAALLSAARDLYAAVTSGEASGWVIAGMGLMLLIGLFRWMARANITGGVGDWLEATFFGADWRGTLTTLLMSALGATATALAGGGGPSLSLLWTSLGVGVVSAGGYSVLWKRLALPLLSKVPKLGDALPETPDAVKAKLPKATVVGR